MSPLTCFAAASAGSASFFTSWKPADCTMVCSSADIGKESVKQAKGLRHLGALHAGHALAHR